MKNQHVAWIVAAIIVAAIIVASGLSKQQAENVTPDVGATPTFSHTDVMEERALACLAAGHVWTGFACNYTS